MCTGAEPLLFEAGGEALAGDLFLGDMAATGAGEGLASMGAADVAGATALGDMAATGAGGGLTAGGLGADYLSTLGGLNTLAGSEFASNMAPFTEGATDVASITGNAVPGLENNIGNFEGIPASGETPITTRSLPGLSQASNVPVELDDYGNPLGRTVGPTGTDIGTANATTMGSDYGTVLGQGSTAMTGSPFSLSNLMSNPMGAVKSAYDTVSKNPIPSMYAAGSLYDMYAKKKMAEKQQAMYDQNRADIMNTYAPGSPEYNLLAQQMARKDAAAGRNSQYGARANDLAATIAKLRMGAIGNLQSSQNTLGNQALGNQYGMFNTPLALAMYSSKT